MICSEDDLVHIENMRRGGQEGEKSFEVLFGRYEKRLRAYLMSKTYHDPSKCDAETVTNDTFGALWKSRHTFRCECSIYTWLSRIAEKRYLNCIRQKKHVAHTLSIENESVKQQIYEKERITSYNIEKEICIAQCIDRLLHQYLCKGKPYAECIKALTLRARGLTYKEIAEEIGRPSVNACKQFIHSCKKKLDKHPLKRCLEECLSD